MTARGIVFAPTHLRSELSRALTKTGWVSRVGVDHLFATLPTAVAGYEQWLRDHPPEELAADQTRLTTGDQGPDD